MKKISLVSVLSMFMVLGFAALAMAAGEDITQQGGHIALVMAIQGGLAAFSVGFAAFGCGMGMGKCSSGCLNAIARNPEAAGKLTVNMFIGLALIEALTIYALVIGLIILYANPLLAKFFAIFGVS